MNVFHHFLYVSHGAEEVSAIFKGFMRQKGMLLWGFFAKALTDVSTSIAPKLKIIRQKGLRSYPIT